MDPNTIRYMRENHEPGVTDFHSKLLQSPEKKLPRKNVIPAASICHVELTVVDPDEWYFEKSDPPAQLMVPIKSIPNPIISFLLCVEKMAFATFSLNIKVTQTAVKKRSAPNTIGGKC